MQYPRYTLDVIFHKIVGLIQLLTVLALPCSHAQPPEIHSNGITIREIQIPMPDGEFLAADLYLPEKAPEGSRFPIILEYLPYRKDEGRTHRFPFYSYFVKWGYMVARVDIRGTGRSTGKLVDGEYSEQELADGEVVIDWLSKQSFSTGAVAMLGISWGGFNALQLAINDQGTTEWRADQQSGMSLGRRA